MQNHVLLSIGTKTWQWTILSKPIRLVGKTGVYHKCRCVCGIVRHVLRHNLTSGVSRSCGCIYKQRCTEMVGQRFGKWVVIQNPKVIQKGKRKTYCLCRCDCGTERMVPKKSLQNNLSKSCGCSYRPNLIGKRFGRLVVLKFAGAVERDGHKHNQLWSCKCDCGTKLVVPTWRLTTSKTPSCGCYCEHKVSYGQTAKKALYSKYRKLARARNLKFELTFDEFIELTIQSCFYCGAKPTNVNRYAKWNGDFIYNGLDRVNNRKGYLKTNVVPCCAVCNKAKHTQTASEFKNWITRVYETFIINKHGKV